MPVLDISSNDGTSRSESWPLLDPVVGPSACESGAEHVRGVKERCRAWWSMTTGVPYLTSPLSRRPQRRVAVSMLACVTVLADCALGAPSPLAGLAALLLLSPTAVLSSSRLRWDGLAAAAAFVHSVIWLISYGDEDEHFLAHSLVMKISYWTFTLSMFAGVHSVFLLGYVVMLSATLSFVLGAAAALLALLCGAAAVLGVAALEHHSGTLLSEWAKQQTCIKNLLEGLSDGACTVDAISGRVETATRKLAKTFEVCGQDSMEGRSFADFLQHARDRGQVEEMLQGLQGGGIETFAPRLMSCQTASGDIIFEAMVVPFSTVERKLSLGVRMVGEKKRSDGQDIWPSDLTATTACCSVAATAGGSKARAPPKDVSFALSWADDTVQMALLAPRKGGTALGSRLLSIGTQTDAPAEPAPAPAAASKPPDKPPPPPATNFLNGPANLPLPPGFHRRPSSRSQGSRRSRPRSVGSLSNTSRTASESSFGSSAGAVGFPSMASCFLDTALLSRRKSVIIAMHHWNLPRNPDACCPWHTAVHAVEEVARLESRTPCKPLWSPFLGWQCPTCTCVNHPTVAPCNVCGSERPASQDQATSQPQQPQAPASQGPAGDS